MKINQGIAILIIICLMVGGALFYAGFRTGLNIGRAEGEKTMNEDATNKNKEASKNTNKNEKKSQASNKQVKATSNAQLHVDGNHLADASGKTVRLTGISTHGLSWFPQYVNKDTFKTLRDDWGANAVRLAMYTAEYNGYCSGGDKTKLKNTIRNGIDYATELQMYVIVDWHILSDCSPMQNKEEAKKFFSEISKEYANNPYVIYEICNEPQNSPWSSVIKPYAEEIIPVIRENAKDAIILCGTNTWSQDVHEVVNDRLSDKNTMYVMHFYAGTHKDDLRKRLEDVLNAGLPVFVSECSITDASGNGAIDYDSASAWMALMDTYNVSFMAWSLANKDESSALLRPTTESISNWTDDELSETGKWFKSQIKKL